MDHKPAGLLLSALAQGPSGASARADEFAGLALGLRKPFRGFEAVWDQTLDMARRWIPITLVATLVVGIAVAVVAAVHSRRTTESPAYALVSVQRGFEIRRYEPRLVAEVVLPGEGDAATKAGFRILADYIAGQNATGAAIAMTIPVERTAKGDAWVIAFTMPAQYSRDTLPAPLDERIVIREIPAKSMAVLRFAGAPRDVAVRERMREFVQLIEAAGFVPSGAPPTFARYDPPWTLPFLRRNEILVELAVEGD